MRVKLKEYVAHHFPGATIVEVEPMPADSGASKSSTTKAEGYGQPIRLVLDDRGQRRVLVWRTAAANDFGHDRRSDRAGETFLAYDDFAAIPDHVHPVDLGAIRADGSLVSLRDSSELYLVTTYAPGTLYVDDLRRLATGAPLTELDLARIDVLAEYLADLHIPLPDGDRRYRRAIRDLVGHGEGIFGMIDGYPADVPGAPTSRLRAIEEACASWRWRLRDHGDRLARTHGDFHPFNIVFDHRAPAFLDASRGGCGDPADDITALAINFLLFAIDAPATWKPSFGVLWHRWWRRCLELRPDPGLVTAAPPFLAWRALVVCNPRFYPNLTARGRDRLLGFAEATLARGALEPETVEGLFR